MKRVLLIGVVLALLGAGSASAGPTSRQIPWQRHSFKVDPGEVARWATDHRFGTHAAVQTGVYVDGREMPNRAYGCRPTQAGHGVAIVVNLCGDAPVPLRTTAVSLDGRPHKVTIVFRVVTDE